MFTGSAGSANTEETASMSAENRIVAGRIVKVSNRDWVCTFPTDGWFRPC